jgi:membrane protein required for colicin V production
VTGYDVFAILVLLASAGAGWIRGGTREIVALFSFVLAAVVSLIVLPWTAPFARGLVDPDWAGSILAVVGVFLVTYFGIRILGSSISKSAQGGALGAIDRILGIVIGLIRALVLVGAVHLVVVGAMPGERTPTWLTNAASYPVSAGAARLIQIVLPGIGRGLDTITPVVDSSVRRGFSDDQALQTPQTGNTSPAAPAE